VISPCLLNVVLHGLEEAVGVRYLRSGTDAAHTAAGSPVLVRYADDLVVLCHSRHQAEQAKARLAAWLAPRGLAFNEDKTRIVTLEEGFDFLGFTVRRYRGKLLIKPAKAAVRRIRERLRNEMRSLRGTNAQADIARLNPVVRGWSAYYRTVVSSQTFTALDHYLWKLTYKWAKHSHPNKPTRWIIRRYFGAFNKSRQDRWVFGDRDSGAYLTRFAWTKSSGTRWSGEPRQPTTPPWPNTGLPGGDEEYPAPSTRPPCGSCSHSTAAAHAAGNSSSTLTGRRKAHVNGNNGWRPSARR
jgi:RNA-directed DNA polymerase